MTVPTPIQTRVQEETPGPPDPILTQDVTVWVGLLMRTLKTCRLYDEANPTVVRFREDLAGSLEALLARTGPLRLDVTSNALAISGHEVHVARSRDDNLAGVFHRDGIRALAFEPGIQPREVDALVDQLLQVTGPAAGDDDLVTLLWDADLPHVAVETVPIEGEADGGGDDGAEPPSTSAWPRQEAGATPSFAAGTPSEPGRSRSDDWSTDEEPADLEQAFDQLESAALFEIARFQQEVDDGADQNLVGEALHILQDCLACDSGDADREELALFVPRLLREALAAGDWHQSAVALRLVRACQPSWPASEFVAGLSGPFAITTRKVVDALDRQEPKDVEAFLELAREFGSELAEWLMHVLAESQRMRVRRPLTRVIAELIAGHPDRIAHWLSDSRWYVVRNVVHILGWIGGTGIVSHLRVASEHTEPRVRREVVAALSQIEHEASRPILVAMLKSADAELFGTILQHVALDDHATITDRLLELLHDESFARRSEEEQRALFRALATRGEEVLPALDALLHQGGLFSTRPEPDRPAVALCIARIGTPAARAILERGLRSNRGAVRKACLIAGASGSSSRLLKKGAYA